MSFSVKGTGALTLPSGSTVIVDPATGDRSSAIATMKKFDDEFAIGKSTNGWSKLPNGEIHQWGTFAVAATGSYVPLLVAFPNAFTAVMTSMYVAAAPGVTTNSNCGVQAQVSDLTRFVARCYQDAAGVARTITWFAVGY